jgi:hypothetical protein
MNEEIEPKQKKFKVQYKHSQGWAKLYVWTTSADRALTQAKAILGEDAGTEWKSEDATEEL